MSQADTLNGLDQFFRLITIPSLIELSNDLVRTGGESVVDTVLDQSHVTLTALTNPHQESFRAVHVLELVGILRLSHVAEKNRRHDCKSVPARAVLDRAELVPSKSVVADRVCGLSQDVDVLSHVNSVV